MRLLQQFICGLLGLYLLNCSVDAPDATSLSATENLYYNEQESIVEWIVEKGLGFEDAIPEFDDNYLEDEELTKKARTLDYFTLTELNINPAYIYGLKAKFLFPPQPKHIFSFDRIDAPPPDFLI